MVARHGSDSHLAIRARGRAGRGTTEERVKTDGGGGAPVPAESHQS